MPTTDADPPLLDTYKSLFDGRPPPDKRPAAAVAEECELPLIDLKRLSSKDQMKQCKRDIVAASSDWGFFQVVNHGIPDELLERMRSAVAGVFRQPFEKKAKETLLGLPAGSYRWGSPAATSLEQVSWSEAYHIVLSSSPSQETRSSYRRTIEEFAVTMSQLAQRLSSILAEGLGCSGAYIDDECTRNTCYLRLNHYPPCPPSLDEVFGLIPHTDSDFMTIVFQDQVGGLQLMKDGKWLTVKPNRNALIINIGDLFQAWSNGVYRSVEHRVVANAETERFSVAYFLCPAMDTVIESREEPGVYRKFTFKEYREQVQRDVKLTGRKVGLPRFLKAMTTGF